MKAICITGPREVQIKEISKPNLGPGEVLLRVLLVGFCGTDLNTYRGNNPMVQFPRIPGHEIAAEIVEIGDGVPAGRLLVGQKATVLPYTACGSCASCRKGRLNACERNQTLGVQRDGAMTEFIVVPWQKVYPSDTLSAEQLTLVEPLTIGFHANNRGEIAPSDTVLVLGCGAIGLGVIAAASWREATVIAVDVDNTKLALARLIGADHTINSSQTDLHQSLLNLTKDGPDVVVEAIGLPETFQAAVEEVAFAGTVIYIGYAKKVATYDSSLFVKKELDIRGSRNASPEDFQHAIAMLEEGAFPAEDLITKIISLDEAAMALEEWDKDPTKVTRILVKM